jgi:Raf kinase inhibitor-like YbhB/YbcL family protein
VAARTLCDVRSRVLAPVLAAILLFIGACGGDDGGDQPSNASPSASDAEPSVEFTLTSPAFVEGGPIPDGFTCDGQDQSPPLAWSVPDGAVELALVMIDVDGPNGGFLHWTAWGIDPAAGALPEASVPAGVVQGTNGANQVGYLGPCPPPGSEPHDYVFTLYALDEPLTLAEGASIDELRAAISEAAINEADVFGTYQRAA